MLIITPQEMQEVAWEGKLVVSQVFRGETGAPPVVTIGKPEVWPVEQALESETGKKWAPPLGEARYWLVRLACTLREPPGRSRIREATQTLILAPRPAEAGVENVYAKDLFPLRVGVEDKGSFTASLGPELGFVSGASIQAGEVGATIEFRKVFPVIQAYGAGESTPYWEFKPHAAYPLNGSQFVYAVLAARKPAEGLRAHVELTVTTQATFGPVKFGMPETARQAVDFSLP